MLTNILYHVITCNRQMQSEQDGAKASFEMTTINYHKSTIITSVLVSMAVAAALLLVWACLRKLGFFTRGPSTFLHPLAHGRISFRRNTHPAVEEQRRSQYAP
jgi:hypothetical protein